MIFVSVEDSDPISQLHTQRKQPLWLIERKPVPWLTSWKWKFFTSFSCAFFQVSSKTYISCPSCRHPNLATASLDTCFFPVVPSASLILFVFVYVFMRQWCWWAGIRGT